MENMKQREASMIRVEMSPIPGVVRKYSDAYVSSISRALGSSMLRTGGEGMGPSGEGVNDKIPWMTSNCTIIGAFCNDLSNSSVSPEYI
jgi:hypothetical protein